MKTPNRIFFCFLLFLINGKLFSQTLDKHWVTIKSDMLEVQISKKGAELKSIKNLKTGKEFLWQGNPDYWALTSPVLFPTIGVSWNDEIHYNGNSYPMKIHGFANKKTFELHKASANEAWFLLKSDEETVKVYPFNFEFLIGFILDKNHLKTVWKVKNLDSKEMYFQIGGHTGFQLPDFDKNADEIGFVKLIEPKNPVQFIVKDAGKHFTENPTIHTLKTDADGLFPLTKEFFKNDAVVFENNQAKEIMLFDKYKNPLVSVITETPIFALWTANQYAPFVCIEPWFGRADNQNFTGDISKKNGVLKLKPKELFTSGYTIKILNQ